MAAPQEIWQSTPEKTNHLTQGWVNKTLFHYHSLNQVTVANGDYVVDEIIADTYNYKGTNLLPANYFPSNNYEDGRQFKITMYYTYPLDGTTTDINVGLYDVTNSIFYGASVSQEVGTSSGYIIIKAQFYCSVFYNTGDSAPYMYINGELLFSSKSDWTNDVYCRPMQGALSAAGGTSVEYKIAVRNRSDSSIDVQYLTIEEVG
jgi:hypothetical protein